MALGAMLQGSIGFGLNVVGAPLLVLIDTRFVPGPTLVAALVLTLLVGVRERGPSTGRASGGSSSDAFPHRSRRRWSSSALPERGIAFALAAVVLDRRGDEPRRLARSAHAGERRRRSVRCPA